MMVCAWAAGVTADIAASTAMVNVLSFLGRMTVSYALTAVEPDGTGMASDGFHLGEPLYRACGEALGLHVVRIAAR